MLLNICTLFKKYLILLNSQCFLIFHLIFPLAIGIINFNFTIIECKHKRNIYKFQKHFFVRKYSNKKILKKIK